MVTQEKAAARVRDVVDQLAKLVPVMERMAPLIQEFTDHRHVCQQCAAAWVSRGVTPPCDVGWRMILATVQAAKEPELRKHRWWRWSWRRA